MNELCEKFNKEYMKEDNPKCWANFYEPDMNNLLTALAFEPIEEKISDKLFYNYIFTLIIKIIILYHDKNN